MAMQYEQELGTEPGYIKAKSLYERVFNLLDNASKEDQKFIRSKCDTWLHSLIPKRKFNIMLDCGRVLVGLIIFVGCFTIMFILQYDGQFKDFVNIFRIILGLGLLTLGLCAGLDIFEGLLYKSFMKKHIKNGGSCTVMIQD